jgi:hypothetical protein
MPPYNPMPQANRMMDTIGRGITAQPPPGTTMAGSGRGYAGGQPAPQEPGTIDNVIAWLEEYKKKLLAPIQPQAPGSINVNERRQDVPDRLR